MAANDYKTTDEREEKFARIGDRILAVVDQYPGCDRRMANRILAAVLAELSDVDFISKRPKKKPEDE